MVIFNRFCLKIRCKCPIIVQFMDVLWTIVTIHNLKTCYLTCSKTVGDGYRCIWTGIYSWECSISVLFEVYLLLTYFNFGGRLHFIIIYTASYVPYWSLYISMYKYIYTNLKLTHLALGCRLVHLNPLNLVFSDFNLNKKIFLFLKRSLRDYFDPPTIVDPLHNLPLVLLFFLESFRYSIEWSPSFNSYWFYNIQNLD